MFALYLHGIRYRQPGLARGDGCSSDDDGEGGHQHDDTADQLQVDTKPSVEQHNITGEIRDMKLKLE